MNTCTFFGGSRFEPNAFSSALKDMLPSFNKNLPNSPLLFLCIGTDRSTGDCLGPLVGQCLEQMQLPGCLVLGTLKSPVHAVNLSTVLYGINQLPHKPFIIAIDAALGPSASIGQIMLSDEALFPGSGVKKDLPPVGEISITGIIEKTSLKDASSLSCVRLSLVMELADCITRGIADFVKSYCFYPQ